MKTGTGIIKEIILLDGLPAARIECDENLIPAPGEYLLSSHASDSPLPDSIFSCGLAPQGFLAAPPIPSAWTPGMTIHVRGTLGRGFSLPQSVRRVALIAYDDSPRRLFPLIHLSIKQDASIVLVSDQVPDDLPAQVEVQPLSSWLDVLQWSDFSAIDAARDSLPGLLELLMPLKQAKAKNEAQILIRAPMPCGGVAECGVCAIRMNQDWKMACKDGPVFDLSDLL